MSPYRVLMVLTVSSIAGWGCAVKAPVECAEPVSLAMTPTEQLLVMKGGADEPMSMVLNDSDAGDEFLHAPSLPVVPGDPVVTRLIERLTATVAEEKGVGIAAPQVGINRRVILVKRLDLEPEQPFVAYVNVQIEWLSEQVETDWEGCLSIPAGFGKVVRSSSVTVKYDSLDGQSVEETVDGYVARIFQHEIDHLDGVLFVDRMEVVDLMPKDEYRAMKASEQDLPADQ